MSFKIEKYMSLFFQYIGLVEQIKEDCRCLYIFVSN